MSPQAAPSKQSVTDYLEQLAAFSATGPGVTRLVYDDAWIAAHHWLRERAAALGLAATSDSAGNLLFHDPAHRPGPGAPPALFVGSHLDSVKHGGRYDGAYGTIAGLLLAAQHRGRPGMPVVGFVTCEEEESRFSAHMMGARSLLGLARAAELDQVKDAAGVSWREALARARDAGCAAPLGAGDAPFVPPLRATRMLELHIEQGPVLEREKLELGIVEHVAGYRRLRARITGQARHSGTTPMAARHDAFAAGAEVVLAAETLARETGEPAVATSGGATVEPGLANVVPGSCELWLEVRHSEAAALLRLVDELSRRASAIGARRGVSIAIEGVSGQEPTPLARTLADAAATMAAEQRVPHRRMTSGAAHDAMEFARAGVPSLMLFVPSRAGISHSPDEYTAPEQLERGVRFASDLIARLAAEGAS